MRTISEFIKSEGIAALLHEPIVESLDENEEVIYISRLCIERDLETWADETNEAAGRYIHRFYGGTESCDAKFVRWISSNAIVLEKHRFAPENVEQTDFYDRRCSLECPHCRRRHFPKTETVWRDKNSQKIFCVVCVEMRLSEVFAAATAAADGSND